MASDLRTHIVDVRLSSDELNHLDQLRGDEHRGTFMRSMLTSARPDLLSSARIHQHHYVKAQKWPIGEDCDKTLLYGYRCVCGRTYLGQ